MSMFCGKYLSLSIYIILLVLTLKGTCIFCLQSEIQALLSFRSNLDDPRGIMDGWDASTVSAPCDWNGISCDGSGRVRELRLPRSGLNGQLADQLGNLRRLSRLSLHSNGLNGSIPRALGECASLRAVYLQYNSLSGEVGFFSNLTNLEVLNVSHNFLSGGVSGNVPTRTRVLDLSSNGLSGEIPGNFSGDHELQLLDLSFNRFSGEIPATIGMLQKLQYLWLDDNELYGTVPSALANCTSLIHVSIGGNRISGVVPETIGELSSLQVLSLPRNQLTGVVSISLLCDNATIRVLDLSFNELTCIENNVGNGLNPCDKSMIEVLDLHENQINDVFPDYLTNFRRLRSLDLSANSLTGNLSDDLFRFLLDLEDFKIANNSITGNIPRSLVQCKRLNVLDVGKNHLSGTIPDFLGSMNNLTVLILGGNSFTGSIPVSLARLSLLKILDLSNNDLTSTVPNELMKLTNLTTLSLSYNRFSDQVLLNFEQLKALEVLNMSGCGFSGNISSSIANLLRLKVLDLSNQRLSGDLPVEIFGLPSLQVVALQENSLSGDVPEGFSSLSSLKQLNLSVNSFTGEIPNTYGFLRSLTVLSLSHNRVNGSIPSELSNCSVLETLELRGNQLSGKIPDEFSNLSELQRLDLGQNDLTGEIPETISNCSSLVDLLLDSNQISGEIPDTLYKLSSLTNLDLSSNNLTGDIPSNLALIPSLQHLNLSSNDLKGEIPATLASRFPNPSIYSNNKGLCGKPLNNNCRNTKSKKSKRLILFITVAVIGSLMLLLCCCGYIYSLYKWHRKLRSGEEKKRSPSPSSHATRSSGENGAPKLVMFNDKFTYAETLEATRQFDEENVLTRARHGLLFRATFLDGMVLAILRILNASTIDENSFRKEAEDLGKVKHRNLTVLRGYYAGPPPNMRLLVYDYMPNGNLVTLLQEAAHQGGGGGHVLNWPMRHLIALGIARGLAFLHAIPIVHGDVKPQNVLFDADFEAHLSEFGLNKLSAATPSSGEASTSEARAGTLGYVAPEVAVTGRPTKEGDVYSFGIVVLEILTGKKPVAFAQEEEDIVKWVKRMLQDGQVLELLEPGLVELDPESSEWEEFLLGLKVGLLCTMTDPVERPLMSDVVFMLEGCRLGPEAGSSADPTRVSSPS